ncbi:hypothetical protein FDENT_11640 [Fusarium denticulatum]|uniref:Secreted protein n=1 Tax=Fusarium denticulatum TaxID=48507 RepID=A0A8H5TH92_9HYPO|nr:hypothetical protein FDENT_11640 [Fusarium denticulatum]
MHYPSFLLTALLAAIPRASGECHRSGETWGGDKFTALEAAQRLCTDGSLSPTGYKRGEFKTFCVNLSTLKKVDFTILVSGNVIGEGFSISSADCTDRLHREINGCDHGGRSSYKQGEDNPEGANVVWDFSADPGSGQCA